MLKKIWKYNCHTERSAESPVYFDLSMNSSPRFEKNSFRMTFIIKFNATEVEIIIAIIFFKVNKRMWDNKAF